jgi:two-component system, NtrC family, response regulator AtoC
MNNPFVTVPTDSSGPVSHLLLVAGEGHFGTYALATGKTLTIGRDRGCDVPLDHPKISRRHAVVHVGDGIHVEDLASTNGTRLAGQRIPERTRLALDPGMSVQFGPFVAVVVDCAAAPSDAGQPLLAAIRITDPRPTGIPPVVSRIAREKVSVLITGETGVGKEVLARTIHELSGRPGQFVGINCAALSESLLESELFGHERGSFTGAAGAKPGLFEVASGGTILLDEIGELPAGLQAKLLRVLETRTVYRVGGVRPVSLDVRFIAATHRDLAAESNRGNFRRDLYFRVNGIELVIAPLKERRHAIPALARELLAKAVAPDKVAPRLGVAALDALMRHDWPGNVRELRSVMERAAVVCDGDEVRASHILLDSSLSKVEPQAPPPPPEPTPAAAESSNKEDQERVRIIAALAACAGNQTYAARMLGISRTTLQHKLAVHRIPRPRKPQG